MTPEEIEAMHLKANKDLKEALEQQRRGGRRDVMLVEVEEIACERNGSQPKVKVGGGNQ